MKPFEKDYSKRVERLCQNRLLEFQSRQEDAQLIADVINVLASENDISVSRAQTILSDAINLIPYLGTI